MQVQTAGVDVVASRASAHGVGQATAAARAGTTRAMGVMVPWVWLARAMSVWLAAFQVIVRGTCTHAPLAISTELTDMHVDHAVAFLVFLYGKGSAT